MTPTIPPHMLMFYLTAPRGQGKLFANYTVEPAIVAEVRVEPAVEVGRVVVEPNATIPVEAKP